MKKLLLCAAAVLGIAASIFGYYYYIGGDTGYTRVEQDQPLEDRAEATSSEIPFIYRGWAWYDSDGTINPNGLANALAQRDLYLAQHMPPDGFGDKGDAASLPGVPDNWLPRGPANVGGRTTALVVHPGFATKAHMCGGGIGRCLEEL
jgi:hypothetical protein